MGEEYIYIYTHTHTHAHTRTHTYTNKCNSKDRSGLAWFRLGLLKLEGIKINVRKKRLPLCNEDENVVHIILKGNDTQRLRKKFQIINGYIRMKNLHTGI